MFVIIIILMIFGISVVRQNFLKKYKKEYALEVIVKYSGLFIFYYNYFFYGGLIFRNQKNSSILKKLFIRM